MFDEDELMEEVDDFANLNGDLKELLSDENDDAKMEEALSSDLDKEDSQLDQKDDNKIDSLETNIGTSDFPSGPTYDLTELDQRIRDALLVLGDFKNRAPPGIKRKVVVDSLLGNLCQRYNYNRFMINVFYDLFPKEVVISSDIQCSFRFLKPWRPMNMTAQLPLEQTLSKPDAEILLKL